MSAGQVLAKLTSTTPTLANCQQHYKHLKQSLYQTPNIIMLCPETYCIPKSNKGWLFGDDIKTKAENEHT